MTVNFYTDGFFAGSQTLLITTHGQSATVGFDSVGIYVDATMTRTDFNQPGVKTGYDTVYAMHARTNGVWGLVFDRATYEYYDRLTYTPTATRDPFTEDVKTGPEPGAETYDQPGQSDFTDHNVYYEPGGYYDRRDERHDIVVNVYFVTRTFTLRYDANGGQGAPAAQTFTARSRVNLRSNPLPTRAMHTFLGYDEDRTTKTPTYAYPGGFVIVLAPARDITLYAIWRADFTYLPMRNQSGIVLRSATSGIVIRHGDE